MIWPFGKQAQLLRELDRLSLYNDKNIAYLKHDNTQAGVERAARISRIEQLVLEIGRDHFPIAFLAAIKLGAVATDSTGTYFRQVKTHFRGGSAP